jgi:predicted esterase
VVDDPHAGQPVRTAGTPLEDADAAVVMLHGRGAMALGMLQLATDLDGDGVAFLALQAADRTWYPDRFVAPIENNEPHLSSALAAVGRVLEDADDAGVPPERTLLLGFSQGACLASEYVARNARRYGGLAVLSGGLVGPEGTPRDYDGDLAGTPVFLGCGDQDPHIAVERVHETRDVLSGLGGDVTEEIYEGMGHGIVAEELEHVRGLVAGLGT